MITEHLLHPAWISPKRVLSCLSDLSSWVCRLISSGSSSSTDFAQNRFFTFVFTSYHTVCNSLTKSTNLLWILTHYKSEQEHMPARKKAAPESSNFANLLYSKCCSTLRKRPYNRSSSGRPFFITRKGRPFCFLLAYL